MATILITGGTGMVGSAFKHLQTKHKLVLVGSRDYNLIDFDQNVRMFREIQPDACIHLAAMVGGIKANTDYVADFCANNITINTNLLPRINVMLTKYCPFCLLVYIQMMLLTL